MPARKVTPNSADRLTITLDSEDRLALDRLAKETDRSLAWIVREAVHQYLVNHREHAGGKGN
jgi:predicted transcriptional regulator